MEQSAHCRITHIGTATVIIEIGSLRILTDPVFDPAGGRYSFGWRTGSTKLTSPTVAVESLGHIDLVLLSHEHHGDNLDRAGRAWLPDAGQVITTVSGERRLRGNAVGLSKWASVEVGSREGLRVKVIATPARHGPLWTRPFVGEVIGFIVEWDGQRHGALYISGDTVWFRGIVEVGRRYRISTAVLHLGGVRFPLYGPIRFTFTGAEAARAAQALNARTIVPIHYEGWTHFRESRAESEQAFIAAGLGDRVLWLPPGVTSEIEV
ncbi:MAG: MBL fold metallo-hydrolase [Candidatus Zhuqueibacterota bacterium]